MGNNMEKSKISVIVYWVNIDDGGKTNLPINVPYYVITDPFKGLSNEEIRWSLVLEIDTNDEKNIKRVGIGKAYFLVEDAPSKLLVKGFSLKVYEGPKFVAIVEVI